MRLSKGIEFLISEQSLIPKLKSFHNTLKGEGSGEKSSLEKPESIDKKTPYRITVTGQSVTVQYKRVKKQERCNE